MIILLYISGQEDIYFDGKSDQITDHEKTVGKLSCKDKKKYIMKNEQLVVVDKIPDICGGLKLMEIFRNYRNRDEVKSEITSILLYRT